MALETSDTIGKSNTEGEVAGKKQLRDIKGNLPYLASPAALPKVLSAAIEAERPEKFTGNWMETVLGLSGGANKPVIAFLKKMGFLTSDGTPTDRYSKFKTDSGRDQAIYEGLKDSYAELFRKNEVVHRAVESKVKDHIIEITGLPPTDNIARLIFNTFENLRGQLPNDFVPDSAATVSSEKSANPHENDPDEKELTSPPKTKSLGLSYHINLVLPETENQAVLDAIFKSIKRNLL